MTEAPQDRAGETAALRERVAALEGEVAVLRKSAESADEPLAAREALLAKAEKSVHLGSWFYDLARREVRWSEELYRILGYDPSRDPASLENWFLAIHPDDRGKSVEDNEYLKETGILRPGEFRIRWKDGTVREVHTDGTVVRDGEGKVVRIVGTVLDVTERRLLEARLRQGHKMEAVGRLAAGVAHDFNNILSVITGNADLLLGDSPDEKLRRIRDAAEVGAALTRQLLSFSRQSVIRPVLLDPGEVARDTTRIIERVIGENIGIHLDLAPCAVLIDRAQLQQILLNLAINARDAMPGGGEIRVSVRPAETGWVQLTVADTGTGMDEGTRARAFEAFFTTKPPGKGTGLGLYAVQDAVLQAGGRIALETAPGEGTVVAIHLPRQDLPAASAAPSPADAEGGGESILVVEDHPALRELIRAFLADGGYRVQGVGRPGEAEAAWAEENGAFDLLITDLVMPEKNGRVLAEELTARKPALKTLFISGYAQGVGPEKMVEGPYLQKPFTRNELLHMVRGIFEGRHGTAAAGRSGADKVPQSSPAQTPKRG